MAVRKKRVVLLERPAVDFSAARGVEPMSGPPVEIVAKLEADGLEHVYVDGGITVQGRGW